MIASCITLLSSKETARASVSNDTTATKFKQVTISHGIKNLKDGVGNPEPLKFCLE